MPAGRSRELPHADETVLSRRYEESGLGGQVHARDPTRVSGDLHQNLPIEHGTEELEYAVPFLTLSKFLYLASRNGENSDVPIAVAGHDDACKEDEADLVLISIGND